MTQPHFIGTAALNVAAAIARQEHVPWPEFLEIARIAHAAQHSLEWSLLALTDRTWKASTLRATSPEDIEARRTSLLAISAAAMAVAGAVARQDRIASSVFEALALGAFCETLTVSEAIDALVHAAMVESGEPMS